MLNELATVAPNFKVGLLGKMHVAKENQGEPFRAALDRWIIHLKEKK
jgi:hypothetical protein